MQLKEKEKGKGSLTILVKGMEKGKDGQLHAGINEMACGGEQRRSMASFYCPRQFLLICHNLLMYFGDHIDYWISCRLIRRRDIIHARHYIFSIAISMFNMLHERCIPYFK